MSAKVLVSSDRSTHIVGLAWEGAIASRTASPLGEWTSMRMVRSLGDSVLGLAGDILEVRILRVIKLQA